MLIEGTNKLGCEGSEEDTGEREIILKKKGKNIKQVSFG